MKRLVLVLAVPCLFGADAPAPAVSFIRDVSPIFTMSGCAGSNCHGSVRGQRGFKLSLFGYEPRLDYDALKGGDTARIDLKNPEKSLLLLKATGEVPHGGGFRFAPDSLQYRTILSWLKQGGSFDDPANAVRIVALTVTPDEKLLTAVGQSVQLKATAKYSDGTSRDVTSWVQYTPKDPDTVRVDAKGLVTSLQTGETAVMVRTMGQAVAARILIASGTPGPDYPKTTANNYIDRHIFTKLRRLNIRPSGLASDEHFLRRVYLDATGLLPTEKEATVFLSSTDSNKRSVLIDQLLERRAFSELWALRFTELFRAGTREAGNKGAKIVYDYIRDSFLARKPYDQFVREVILSQGAHSFPNSSMDGVQNAPTSFYNISFDSNAPDHATNISQLFLGVRLECAKCHNHPWEKWTQDDFYGFAAFFARVGIKEVYENDENATQYMEEGSVEHPKTKKRVDPRFLDGGPIHGEQDADIRERLVDWMVSPKNPFFARTIANRVWKNFMGRGLVEEVDDFRVTNPASHPELLDELAAELIRSRYDLRALIRSILNSRAYQLSAEPNDSNRTDTRNYSHFGLRRLPAEQILDALAQVTGVKEKFPGYPPGTRAGQIYGAGGGYMLASFGRLNRDIICERDTQPDMAQTMHLISGSTIATKVSGAKLDLALTDDQLLDRIYVTSLARRPSDAERTAIRSELSKRDRRMVYEDLLWAILNSKEFLYQH